MSSLDHLKYAASHLQAAFRAESEASNRMLCQQHYTQSAKHRARAERIHIALDILQQFRLDLGPSPDKKAS